MLTWRKMTVAVCLVVALRTIDLRCADMTDWSSSQIVLACKKKWRDALFASSSLALWHAD
jgi:hypothetical protein